MHRDSCIAELAAAILAIGHDHPVRVAIDGVDGVGKTTLADELVGPTRQFGREIIRASVDGFHHPRRRRYARGADSPEGYFVDSFDHDALKRELLEPLGPGGTRRYRRAVFNYRVDAPVNASAEEAQANAILLFDGVFLLRPELRAYWDFAIWVDAPFSVTVHRAVHRDAADDTHLEAVRDSYERRYVPGQRIYLSRCRPIEHADVVLNNADFANPKLRYRARSGAV